MTMKAPIAAALACAVCLAAGTLMRAAPPAQPPSLPPAQKNAVLSDGGMKQLLFPGLNREAITAISLVTPDQNYLFQLEGANGVSVNGTQADSEVFATLLDQIAALPVDSVSDFVPRTEPLLTLVVHAGNTQHTAHFYADGMSREKTCIVAGPEHAPSYRQTGLWRVGTLLMTCEGTRIQDTHGNETPIQ